MKCFFVLHRQGVCIEVTEYEDRAEATERLNEVLLQPGQGLDGNVYYTDGPAPVKVGDMQPADSSDEMDFKGLDG